MLRELIALLKHYWELHTLFIEKECRVVIFKDIKVEISTHHFVKYDIVLGSIQEESL